MHTINSDIVEVLLPVVMVCGIYYILILTMTVYPQCDNVRACAHICVTEREDYSFFEIHKHLQEIRPHTCALILCFLHQAWSVTEKPSGRTAV